MPQLDIVYIFMTYLWTWLMIYLLAQKIKTTMMTKNPVAYLKPNKTTPTLPWL